jgi:hypothetical protein
MKLKKYAKGGQNKPIITNNPKDPRLQAYNDSLQLSNQINYLRDSGKPYSFEHDQVQEIIQNNYVYGADLFDNPKNIKSFDRLSKQNGIEPSPIWKKLPFDENNANIYKQTFQKPVQPIIYQPKRTEQPIQIDNIIPTLNTYQPENNLVESPKNYFTRPRQPQEAGQGKTDMFDKKTGKLIATYADGGFYERKSKSGRIFKYKSYKI